MSFCENISKHCSLKPYLCRKPSEKKYFKNISKKLSGENFIARSYKISLRKLSSLQFFIHNFHEMSNSINFVISEKQQKKFCKYFYILFKIFNRKAKAFMANVLIKSVEILFAKKPSSSLSLN